MEKHTMKYLMTFENFTASTPISKGEEIEMEKEKLKKMKTKKD